MLGVTHWRKGDAAVLNCRLLKPCNFCATSYSEKLCSEFKPIIAPCYAEDGKLRFELKKSEAQRLCQAFDKKGHMPQPPPKPAPAAQPAPVPPPLPKKKPVPKFSGLQVAFGDDCLLCMWAYGQQGTIAFVQEDFPSLGREPPTSGSARASDTAADWRRPAEADWRRPAEGRSSSSRASSIGSLSMDTPESRPAPTAVHAPAETVANGRPLANGRPGPSGSAFDEAALHGIYHSR